MNAIVNPPTQLELGQLAFDHVCAQLRRMPQPIDRFMSANPLETWRKHRAHTHHLKGRPANAIVYAANYSDHVEWAFDWWTHALWEEARRLQGGGSDYERSETGRLKRVGDLTWNRDPPLPKLQMGTDREIGAHKFADGAHQEWLRPETQLAILWIEPGGRRNEGITGAVVDVINLAERLNVPLWLVFDVRHPYGPRHPHRDERIDQWLEAAAKVELAERTQTALPTKVPKKAQAAP